MSMDDLMEKARQQLARFGQTLHKVPSSHEADYEHAGPYLVTDSQTKAVLRSSLQSDDVIRYASEVEHGFGQ